MSALKIKQIPTTPLIDVFQDEGWEKWTRLLRKGDTLVPLKGEILTKEQLNEIKQTLKPKKV